MKQEIEIYKQAVIKAMEITDAELMSGSRIQDAVLGRMLLSRFCFRCGLSFRDIAKVINKDRTTVIYMIKRSNELIASRDQKLLKSWQKTIHCLQEVDAAIAERFPIPDEKKQLLEQQRLLLNRLGERELWLTKNLYHPDFKLIRDDKNAIIDQLLDIEVKLQSNHLYKS